MTYIVGCRCPDGVVLVADRKVTFEDGSSEIDCDGKLIGDLGGIIIGYAGSRGSFELLRTQIIDYAQSEGGISLAKLIVKVSDITYELGRRHPNNEMEVLIGIKSPSEPSILKYMTSIGIPETVKNYKVIGGGEEYGAIFFNRIWRDYMKMCQVAELGYFIIKYIEKFGLDPTVGVGSKNPQIWFIPNEGDDHPADESLLEKLETNNRERLNRLEQSIVSEFHSILSHT